VRLLGLNSNQIAGEEVIGAVDPVQLAWVEERLKAHPKALWLVMVHHNLIEHLPGQRTHPLLSGYILQSDSLARTLAAHGVQLVLTGHLHVQDIALEQGIYEITTGSLVSYPHPYRLVEYRHGHLQVQTRRIEHLPGWADLPGASREHMARGSERYLVRLLSAPPLAMSQEEAVGIAAQLRYFWATIAAGDAHFEFEALPAPVRDYFARFNDRPPADNDVVLPLWADRPERFYLEE
jgi:hypothetical protein